MIIWGCLLLVFTVYEIVYFLIFIQNGQNTKGWYISALEISVYTKKKIVCQKFKKYFTNQLSHGKTLNNSSEVFVVVLSHVLIWWVWRLIE